LTPSVYSFDLKDAIVRQTDSTGADYFLNAGGTTQTGFEVWFNVFPVNNSNHFIRSIALSNSFAYQPYKFNNYILGTKDYSGNHLTGVPKNVNVTTLDIYTGSRNLSYFKFKFYFFHSAHRCQ
jgi:iron complex outermembrane receptor protein